MKRARLTKDEKEKVEAWLCAYSDTQEECCPFLMGDTEPIGYFHRVCESWFPKSIPDANDVRTCPCYAYKKATVIEQAREMLKHPTKRR